MCKYDVLDFEKKTRKTNKKYKYTFTVFTPTFNRAHTLNKVYNSLNKQTFKDFEWLVVDDGSVDNTKTLIEQWKNEASFNIRYFYQKNSGKHVAINKGVREAKGKFFLILDSDDACVPETLERFLYHWNSIPKKERKNFSGVSVLCMDPEGKIIGNKFPQNPCDLTYLELMTRYRVVGEKWGFHRTEVLKEFPFPEINGEKFIPEGIVWNRIGQKYKIRHVNEKLRIYEILSDGLSASSIKIRAKNPLGARLYYQEFIKLPIPLRWRLRNLINYIRFSLHAHIPINKIISESGYKYLAVLLLPIGYMFYRKDLSKLK
jgi:glycosyltransferase involved in cell wall biosynthesis